MRSTTPEETIVIAFQTRQDAHAALQSLRQLQTSVHMKLRRGAVICRSRTGDLDVSETKDVPATKKGLLVSLAGLCGFVVGLLWRGVLFGAIVGFVAGQVVSIAASVIDLGYGDMYLKELAADVEPGRSELVATVSSRATQVADLLLKKFPGATIVAVAAVNREGLPLASQHAQFAVDTSAGTC